MADLVITATSVAPTKLNDVTTRLAGEAITAGKAVYIDSTTDTVKLADNNSATTEARAASGIALNGAAVGQPVAVQQDGPITIGATLTPGTAYYLSDTPGGICAQADLATGENVCLLGLARSTTVLQLAIRNLDTLIP